MAILLALLFAQGEGPREETVKVPGGDLEFTLVRVPGGKVKLGSPAGEAGREVDEGPVREVEVKPFWIGKLEVSWAHYTLYYESHKQARVDGVTRPTQPDVVDPKEPFESGGEQSPEHPALGLGWYGAMGYCDWLSKKTGQDYRLPTEAEWEHAARAGSAAAAPEPLSDHAWTRENSKARTHPVGGKKPNAWGLHDVLGNVMEHCLEPYAPPDMTGAVRGAAWISPASEARHANRQKVLDEKWLVRDPKTPIRAWWLTDAPFVGFRVVRTADDGASAEERQAARKKLEVRKLEVVSLGKAPYYIGRVRGEVAYAGDRPLSEVEVMVYFLDEEERPIPKDPRDKPAFNKGYPVLVNSYHAGAHRNPLKKGETRAFEVDVPRPADEVGVLDVKGAAGHVTRVRFSKD